MKDILHLLRCSLAIVLGVFLTLVSLCVNAQNSPRIIAHRGGGLLYPDNTIEGIKGGFSVGADWVEVDIWMTKDGRFVLSHDKKVALGNGESIKISDAYYSEIEGILPSLEEAFAALGSNGHILLEVKEGGCEAELAALISNNYMQDRVAIQSFDEDVLETMSSYLSELKVEILVLFKFTAKKYINHPYISSINVRADAVDQELVDLIHANSKEVKVWCWRQKYYPWQIVETPDSPLYKQFPSDMGIDGFITDYPDCKSQIVWVDPNQGSDENMVVNPIPDNEENRGEEFVPREDVEDLEFTPSEGQSDNWWMIVGFGFLIITLICYIVARIKSKNGELCIVSGSWDKFFLLAGPVCCFIAALFNSKDTASFSHILVIVSGVFLVITIIMSILSNAGSVWAILVSIGAKLFIFALTIFVLFILLCILIIAFIIHIVNSTEREEYVIRYDEYLDAFICYRR